MASVQDSKEAEALYDFRGRTERELSFKKGDILILFEKVSADWWEGACSEQEGLIPDKYIIIRQRCVVQQLSVALFFLTIIARF